MRQFTSLKSRNCGFTILEIMLVMVLMAMVIGSISFSFDIRNNQDKVEDEAKRFQAVFQLASDYALLNNLQLGLMADEISYQFLGFDGKAWQVVQNDDLLGPYELEEGYTLALTVGEIPWLLEQAEDESLFDSTDDDEENEDDGSDNLSQDESNQKKLIPQVYLFSSGEITPFTLTMSYEKAFSNEDIVEYEISGEFDLPLKVVNLAEQVEP